MLTMSGSLSNKHVLNKYLWMSHQLRHFNDAASIINWSNAMFFVKRLLLEPLPAVSTPTSTISPSALRTSSWTLLSISNPRISSINIPPAPISDHESRSITPPTTISFKPVKKMPLTRSLVRSPSCPPSRPSALTTYTLCNSAASSDTLPRQPKRRKLIKPPSVEYNASPTIPAKPSQISEFHIKQAVWSVLEKHRTRGLLYWEKDLNVPVWVRSQVEEQLKISLRSQPYKNVVLETVNNFYYRYEKKLPIWTFTGW